MIAYRGRLSGPLSTCPAELAAAVARERAHRVLAVGVCRNDHVLVTVVETSMGRVALWHPSVWASDPGSGRRFLTRAEWVATFDGDEPPSILRARCRCTTVRAVDVRALLDAAATAPRRRVSLR